MRSPLVTVPLEVRANESESRFNFLERQIGQQHLRSHTTENMSAKKGEEELRRTTYVAENCTTPSFSGTRAEVLEQRDPAWEHINWPGTCLRQGPQGRGIITSREGNQYRGFVTSRVTLSNPNTSFCGCNINLSMRAVDMSQMLGVKDQAKTALRRGSGPGCGNFVLALELLSGCGMILRAKLLRTSPTDGRCHGSLSFRVHPSSVIWCNGLNLSRGSRV